MNDSGDSIDIVAMVGKENLQWLATQFCRETRLRDLPEEILDRVSSVDIAVRDYRFDGNAVTAIALITFAYQIGAKPQESRYASHNLLLMKVLAKNESRRRNENRPYEHEALNLPLFELITGEVGSAIRAAALMTNPM